MRENQKVLWVRTVHAAAFMSLMLWCGTSSATVVVHMVFSNHLDVGFHAWGSLGYDNAVVNTYFNLHFPRAVQLGKTSRSKNAKFVYTTQPFLLSLYLDCPTGMGLRCPNKTEVSAVRDAIQFGDISWHALPHNSQVEMYDPELFESAINISRGLDRQFGFPPKVTMSQRDVPGLTRGAVPLLSRVGVKVLTVGVNGGSAPPAVPHYTPFIWKDPETGEQILAMWHPGGYGGWWDGLNVDSKRDCIRAEGFDRVLCVSWRGDNDGPPMNWGEVEKALQHIQDEFPGAEVRVGDFEEYAEALLEAVPSLSLPVITAEIGDTWIHGVASDPEKLADYRSVLRLRRSCLASGACSPEDPKFQNFSRLLTKVPEHTWGLDTKDGLNDYVNWTNSQLEACLVQRCGNYEAMLLSWRRQYAYIPWAVEALGKGHPVAKAFKADRAARLQPPSLPEATPEDGSAPMQRRWRRADGGSSTPLAFSNSRWSVVVDSASGTISRLQRKWGNGAIGVDWAGGNTSRFLMPHYSSYDEGAFQVIWDKYFYSHDIPDWFLKDFGKLNCSTANPRRAETAGMLEEVHAADVVDDVLKVHLRFTFPEWAVKEAGAPPAMWVLLRSGPPGDDTLRVSVGWAHKTATRLPEALWVGFHPGEDARMDPESWMLNKLGSWISPVEVMRNGSKSLHLVQDEGVRVDSLPAPTTPTTTASRRRLHHRRSRMPAPRERLQIKTLDAGLVSPGSPTVFPNVDRDPDMGQGVAFNLVNNIWGTNYVMWFPYEHWQATMRFRFELSVEQLSAASAAV